MSDINIFEVASRAKLRFATSRGEVPVETLWDLPLQSKVNTSLDSIAVQLDNEIRSTATKSFVDESTSADKILSLKFEIVKHIIKIRLEENKIKTEKAALEDQRRRLKEAIAEKQSEALLSGSLEELQERLKTLG